MTKAKESKKPKMHYQVFISDMGKYEDSSKYIFMAEFAEKDLVTDYIRNVHMKGRFFKKDIIVKEVTDTSYDKPGKIGGVITVLGEGIPLEECHFR